MVAVVGEMTLAGRGGVHLQFSCQEAEWWKSLSLKLPHYFSALRSASTSGGDRQVDKVRGH